MKKLVFPSVTFVLLIAISCTKESIRNSSTTNVQTSDNVTAKVASHYIGERFGGGIIYAINSTGTHGLIADTVDLPAAMWWNGTNIVTGATDLAIGKGTSNTKKIILAQGTAVSYAALECASSKRSGYTDWFLPSKDELKELYKKRNVVGGFEPLYYWSSSEYTTTNVIGEAGAQSFAINFVLSGKKSYSYNVRAIRYF